ncbi:MAG: diguanylate cyclase [Acidobacteriota bacterium]
MSETIDFIDEQDIDRLADESGLAIAIVDGSAREILAANNNSICRTLNPDSEFTGQCAEFCGTALDKTTEAGAAVSFTCHAGLECRAVPVRDPQRPLVAIVGRTFVRAEDYRKATTRAISGDWSQYPPSQFFENILLTGSADVIEKTANAAEAILAKALAAAAAVKAEEEAKPPSEPDTPPLETTFPYTFDSVEQVTPAGEKAPTTPVDQVQAERRTAEMRAWRSFFGSLLKTDYPKATNSILEFLAAKYGFSSLTWLERKDRTFENVATFGEMKQRKVRLGITTDDARLNEALQNERPLELSERASDEGETTARTMSLFPVGVGGTISGAIAILDQITDEDVKKQIARICNSIAPQIEILRLRCEVARGETLSTAVRRFSESLKRLDTDDLWLNLTRNAAEMLHAERASLLIYDEEAENLEIKAIIGARSEMSKDDDVGGRVARIVFGKNEPVAVSEVSKTGLPPAPPNRQYKTSSFLSCPISISGRNIGVMSFTDQASGKAFDKTSLELFQAIAPQLAVAIDRAVLKEKAGEFEQLSVTDPLTGLLNRRYIEERLIEEVKRSSRHGFPMSFMMLDVDHFKSYNDEFGHPAGDEALKLVARVIRDTLRSADVAARFGGEEFSILLPQTTIEEAFTIAQRIRSNIEQTNFLHRRVTVSIGVTSCSAESCATVDLVKLADDALYEAKRLGRNLVRAFQITE